MIAQVHQLNVLHCSLLTEEDCTLLGRPSAFTPGTSLIQVAVRFQSEDVLALLLTSGMTSFCSYKFTRFLVSNCYQNIRNILPSHIVEMEAQTIKRMPSHISPDIAADILRHVSVTLR